MTSVAPAPRKQFELPPHGALVYIPELFAAADGMLTRRIRVLGQCVSGVGDARTVCLSPSFVAFRLVEYSPADDLMIIEYGNQSLLVDTKLLDVFSHRLKSIYQLIGDVDELEVRRLWKLPPLWKK